MIEFVQYILDESAWLYTRIYQNRLFFFDLWSFVHLWSGFVFYLFFRAARMKMPLIGLLALLFVYEVIEILFAYFAFHIFRPETIKDQVTDILVGMAGGYICLAFLRAAELAGHWRHRIITGVISFMAGATFAFFWVGFYHYTYNVSSYNTAGINLSSFSAWTSGGILIILLFLVFRRYHFLIRLGLTWLSFMIVLLAFEYFFYYLLEVRETTGYPLKPLIWGLIHGTRTLHFVYLTAPFIILSLYLFGTWLVRQSIRHQAGRNVPVVG